MSDNEWIELVPNRQGARYREPVLLAMEKEKGKPARCRLNFSEEVAASLVAIGGGKVRVQLGSGENRHCLAVTGDPSGKFSINLQKSKETGRKPTGRYILRLPVVETFPDIHSPNEEVRHRWGKVGDMRVLFIDLPRMCWVPELKLREEEKYQRRAAK